MRTPPMPTAIPSSNREPAIRRGVEPPQKGTGNSEATDRLIGATVDGRYVLERRIARGAMGCVYLARQMPFDRLVAVKLLDPKGASEEPEVFEERFVREASALARLQHPNTVKVYDYGHWKGRTFLVMEYVDGNSLRRLQAGGPIPASRLINIARQICDALQEAHGMGLIHRDLKPANLLITRRAGALDVVKVVDFGLAKEFYGNTELTQAGQVLGTPMFMAPEQIRDEDCDQRTDIYALGVLMYRSLTGVMPFDKGPAMQVLMAHLKERAPSFSQADPSLDLPKMLEQVVFRCLEKNPDDRFANVIEVRKALDACDKVLANPAFRDLSLQVEDGHTVVPLAMCETSASHEAVPPVDLQPVHPPSAEHFLGTLPGRVVGVLLGVVGLAGLLGGAALERMLGM